MSDVGGQAVIEGVMMRLGNVWSVAVRTPDKDIVIKRHGISELPKIFKKPLIRGVIALFQSLSIGIKALLYSAEVSGHETEKPSSFSLVMTVAIAFIMGIGLFLLLPLYGTKLLGMLFRSINESSLVFNFVDGILRVLVFLAYIFAINISKDIRRVFEYHGAEHMAVNAHEAGVELKPEIVGNYSVVHARCGTSFLLIVMILSILVFSLIPKDWPFFDKFLSRLLLIPFIAGGGYEFVKFSSKRMHHSLVRAMAAPGLLLQKMTTGIPSSNQIEVAIRALKDVLNTEGEKAETKESESGVS